MPSVDVRALSFFNVWSCKKSLHYILEISWNLWLSLYTPRSATLTTSVSSLPSQRQADRYLFFPCDSSIIGLIYTHATLFSIPVPKAFLLLLSIVLLFVKHSEDHCLVIRLGWLHHNVVHFCFWAQTRGFFIFNRLTTLIPRKIKSQGGHSWRLEQGNTLTIFQEAKNWLIVEKKSTGAKSQMVFFLLYWWKQTAAAWRGKFGRGGYDSKEVDAFSATTEAVEWLWLRLRSVCNYG